MHTLNRTESDENVQPSKMPTSIFDLPDEMLEHVAKMLDQNSLASFGRAFPRAFHICLRLRTKITFQGRFITKYMMACTYMNPSIVRELDLSRCKSYSGTMKKFIMMFTNLEVLNVKDSGLSMQHLMELLEKLKKLKNLSFSIGEDGEGIRVGEYPNIRSLDVIIDPTVGAFNITTKILQACKKAEWSNFLWRRRIDDSVSVETMPRRSPRALKRGFRSVHYIESRRE